MKLIGMLDSPYVRRSAISMDCLGLPFEHESVSVFRHMDTFASYNPLFKAPTLVCDDGLALMDSNLIIDLAEKMSDRPPLMPIDTEQRRQALRVLGVGLVACEKSVQLFYERELRPAELQHQDWVDRVIKQLHTAYDLLEDEFSPSSDALTADTLTQIDISTAVFWRFSQLVVADVVHVDRYPGLVRHSAHCEQLDVFSRYSPLE